MFFFQFLEFYIPDCLWIRCNTRIRVVLVNVVYSNSFSVRSTGVIVYAYIWIEYFVNLRFGWISNEGGFMVLSMILISHLFRFLWCSSREARVKFSLKPVQRCAVLPLDVLGTTVFVNRISSPLIFFRHCTRVNFWLFVQCAQ